MSQNPQQLRKLLSIIQAICMEEGNEWFKNDLKTYLLRGSDTNPSSLVDIKKDTSKIRYFLSINPELSIDYSFINHKLLRTRLELDNLRMENARYDLSEKDEMKRFYDFCANAFYQIENLINYYYFASYPKIEDLLYHLENIERTRFKRKDEKNVGDITIATKIYSFNKTFYRDDPLYVGYSIDKLREIRNEGVHRCTSIKNSQTENENLYKFLKYATFDSIHSSLNSLTLKVKELLTS